MPRSAGAAIRATAGGASPRPRARRPTIVDKLNSEFVKLFTDPQFVAFLDKNAVVSATTTPDGFAEFLKEDRQAAEVLIKIANAKREEYDPATTK